MSFTEKLTLFYKLRLVFPVMQKANDLFVLNRVEIIDMLSPDSASVHPQFQIWEQI